MTRLDVYLVEEGFFKSRKSAQAAILAGEVRVGDEIMTKPGCRIKPDMNISVKEKPRYVSRGGLKLEKALAEFKTDIKGLTCLDVGSSTGGFSDCLLQAGAEYIYCVDSGTNQLDYGLRNNPSIEVHEKTNARYMDRAIFQKNVDLVVMDVSFISIRLIIPRLKETLPRTDRLISLVKPQFEGNPELVEKGGIVRSQESHVQIITELMKDLAKLDTTVNGFTWSPVSGTKGNIEYFMDIGLKSAGDTVLPASPAEVIQEAFLSLS